MPPAHNASVREALDLWLGRLPVPIALRHVYLTAILLMVWITPTPYTSLQVESATNGPLNYTVFGLMAGLSLLLVHERYGALAGAAGGTMSAYWVWLVVNAVLSTSPSVSVMRLVLVAFAFVLAASLPLLAGSEATLNRCIAFAAWTLLALCYLGVMLVPDLATHTQHDIAEPHLAGDWRGTFGHKNSTAPVMAMLVFVGLHLLRSGNLIGGVLMVASSAIFLFFSGGKTATALCAYTVLVSWLLLRLTSLRAMALVAFVPLALLNVISIGSVLFPQLRSVLAILPVDASFTGRSDIWSFVLDAIRMRPILGYGFAAFWGEPASANLQPEGDTAWAVEAAHSHNGYLDLAVTIGLPGLALSLLVFLYNPLRNYCLARRIHPDSSLLALFLQIWLFGIHLASMETVFLYRIEPGWFTFLLATFALHYFARFPSAAGEPSTI
ncbi:O-antigen ligase [Bradyrhizobium sp. UFLA05-109]